MQHKIFLFSVCAILMLSSIGIVSAVPAAPSPTCHITAEILNATYHPAYFQEDNGLPCNNGGRNIPAHYLLELKINNVSTVQEAGSISCEERYPINGKISVTPYDIPVDYSKIKVLEGDIHFGGDECNSGIFLKDYNIITLKETIFQKILSWFKGLFAKKECLQQGRYSNNPKDCCSGKIDEAFTSCVLGSGCSNMSFCAWSLIILKAC